MSLPTVAARCVFAMSASCFLLIPIPTATPSTRKCRRANIHKIELLDCERRYEGERLFYDRHFSSIADECRGAASLLDVGCGTGQLLERFADRPAVHRIGIELNPEAANSRATRPAAKFAKSPSSSFRSDQHFDVITMINVFSHIPSFDGMFRSLRAALASRRKGNSAHERNGPQNQPLESGALGHSGRPAFSRHANH